jgi:hypothetical protein
MTSQELPQSSRINSIDILRGDGDGLHGFEIADADEYILFFGRPKS